MTTKISQRSSTNHNIVFPNIFVVFGSGIILFNNVILTCIGSVVAWEPDRLILFDLVACLAPIQISILLSHKSQPSLWCRVGRSIDYRYGYKRGCEAQPLFLYSEFTALCVQLRKKDNHVFYLNWL